MKIFYIRYSTVSSLAVQSLLFQDIMALGLLPTPKIGLLLGVSVLLQVQVLCAWQTRLAGCLVSDFARFLSAQCDAVELVGLSDNASTVPLGRPNFKVSPMEGPFLFDIPNGKLNYRLVVDSLLLRLTHDLSDVFIGKDVSIACAAA